MQGQSWTAQALLVQCSSASCPQTQVASVIEGVQGGTQGTDVRDELLAFATGVVGEDERVITVVNMGKVR
jgi:hypothetical protein